MASNYNNQYECYGNDLTQKQNYRTKKTMLTYEVPLQDPFKMSTASRKTKHYTFVDDIDYVKNGQTNVDTLKMYGQKLHSTRTTDESIQYIYEKKSQLTKNTTERKNHPAFKNIRNSSSPLVHQFTTNNFPININNNIDNNNYVRRSYQKSRQRQTFPKDEFDGYEEIETGQLMRAQSPNRPAPLVEDHYNRYFFYEYNRKFSPPPSRNKTSRKLPSLLMATYANKSFLENNSQIIRKENEMIQRNTRKKREADTYENKKLENLDNQNYIDIHGFKDKIPNNNNNNTKHTIMQSSPEIEVIKGCGDYLDPDILGENGNTILKKELPKEVGSKKSKYPVFQPVQSRSSTYSLVCQENNTNILQIKENNEKINQHRQVTTSAGSKKTKGPRVLLYNTNSPRLQGKPSSTYISGKSPSQHRFNETKRSLAMSPVRVNRIHIKQQIKPNIDKVQPENNHNGVVLANTFNNNVSDDSTSDYDDIDDDFNNVSDLIVSDDSESSSDAEEGYRTHTFKMIHPSDRISATQSYLSPQTSEESIRNPISLLVPSLFPNVPPYLSFSSNNEKGPDVPPELHRILKWRVSNVMPKVVRCVLSNSGMRLVKKTNEWMGVWGKHMKSPCFKAIRPYQKINHLPGSFKIGRKDSCWKNLKKNMGKHSKRDFGFMPRTYIIPSDLHNLRKHWPKYAQKNVKWIIKPPASARGAGIRVINRWAQIPKRKPLIVQRYIERPLLINGSKFDLRLYVLVTSINPLRVFLYHNGLARFASVKYSDRAETLNDRCMHLTNYSINKFSSNYSKNEDVNACHGHKWTLKSLWTYLANRGVRTDNLWEAMRNLVLRTVLAGESTMNNMIKYNVESKYSCYELFGFDVILDSELIPWLLEVNISPSLHSDLPLDAHVKAPLVQSVLNTALYNIPPKLTYEKQKEIAAQMNYSHTGSICYDKRLYVRYLSRAEKLKHETFTRKGMEDRDEYIHTILEHLTPDDVRCLIIAEDELARCAPLERIFPTNQTYKYLKCTENPRYYNRLLDAWEARYSKNRAAGIDILRKYCEVKYHLQVPPPPAKKEYFIRFLRWILKS